MAILIEKIQNDNRDLVFKIRTDSYRDMIDQQFMGIQNQEDIAQKGILIIGKPLNILLNDISRHTVTGLDLR